MSNLPWPIKPYPKNPPPKWPGATVADCTFTMPECNVLVDGAELAARYEMGRSGECYLRAIKINGTWHDPIAWGMSPAAITCIENECAEIERDCRAEGVE